jgi:hypothetical protein
MERMGPESLMLMAAAPIACRARPEEGRLWEIPIEAGPRQVALLAATPVVSADMRPAAHRGLLAWLHLARDGRNPAEF